MFPPQVEIPRCSTNPLDVLFCVRAQRLEPGEIRAELLRQTVGQSQAVQQIVTALRQFSLASNDPEHRKLLLLPFIGWVGVGKVGKHTKKSYWKTLFIPDTHGHSPLSPTAV